MQYDSTKQGKQQFVTDKLEPLLTSIDMGWDKVDYIADNDNEYVTVVNKNPSKTIKVNVTADSIRALAEDVLRKIFNI